jgi:hypothetical protein
MRHNQVMPTYADYVATLAFAVTGGKIGLEMRQAASNRPHLRASVSSALRHDQVADTFNGELILRLRNVGAVAAKVTNVLMRSKLTVERDRFRFGKSNSDLRELEAHGDDIIRGPVFPCHIQPLDEEEWAFSEDYMKRLGGQDTSRMAPLVQAAVEFLSPAWPPYRLTARDAFSETNWINLWDSIRAEDQRVAQKFFTYQESDGLLEFVRDSA